MRCTIPCACHTKGHLNTQKCSVPFSFLHFWLGNVLRATTACTFLISQLPKVVREWCALYILTWKCASRHNGVHFFDISTTFWLANVLRATTACNFSSLIWPHGSSAPAALVSLLFDPPEPHIIGKNTEFRDFPTFSRTWHLFFFSLFLFSDLLSSALLLSDSSHLCFSIKLPSNMVDCGEPPINIG